MRLVKVLRECRDALGIHDGLHDQALQLLFHAAKAHIRNVGFVMVALAALSTDKESFHARHKMVFQEVKFWRYVIPATIDDLPSSCDH